MQRLDKFLTNNTELTRSEAVKAIKLGRVKVDELVITKNDLKIDESRSKVFLDGNVIKYDKYIYIMLNKPSGIVSATNDKNERTVVDLLPEVYSKRGIFPCGRLDKDTVGLLILTNDGANAHRLLAPKNHISKTYEFVCELPLTEDIIKAIEAGVVLKDGYKTKPCKIEKISNISGKITIFEGKYHEIKRIFGAMGNKIIFLKRVSFGNICLDNNLMYGEFRELNDSEKDYFIGKTEWNIVFIIYLLYEYLFIYHI